MNEKQLPSHEDGKNTSQSKSVTRRQFITRAAIGAGAVAASSALVACGGSSSTPTTTSSSAITAQNQSGAAWKFGVMCDTQWTGTPDDGYNPNTAAIAISKQIQQQFISQGVKFVVQVGDLSDNGLINGTDTRALFAQTLYNAGIGYFPLRGNHDDPNAAGATEFLRMYPQTVNGVHNNTPSDVLGTFASTDAQIQADKGNQPAPAKSKADSFTLGSNFSSPSSYSGALAGLSYAFDFNNARFVLLDQFTPKGLSNGSGGWDAGFGSGSQTTINNQQSWISSQLSGRAANTHAFVFSHKGLITCQHVDVLFGSDPSQNPSYQNSFMSSLASNKAAFYIHGHDHIYDRSLIVSPDGKSVVHQILASSDSSKFYVPAGSSTNYKGYSANGITASSLVPLGSTNDIYYNKTAGLTYPRRYPVNQELYTVGFYIFTVDGSNVMVDYYAANVNTFTASAGEVVALSTNGLSFTRRETFGSSLNGKQYTVTQGKSYASGAVQVTYPTQSAASGISDISNGTIASILYGSNNSAALDACQQSYTKVVTTGWTSATGVAASDILTLRGINPVNGGSQTDTYVLSLALNNGAVSSKQVLAAVDANGNWTNAVNLNQGYTSKNQVYGAWSGSYTTPGTYGYDPNTNSVWAVLNYDGVFAIVANV